MCQNISEIGSQHVGHPIILLFDFFFFESVFVAYYLNFDNSSYPISSDYLLCIHKVCSGHLSDNERSFLLWIPLFSLFRQKKHLLQLHGDKLTCFSHSEGALLWSSHSSQWHHSWASSLDKLKRVLLSFSKLVFCCSVGWVNIPVKGIFILVWVNSQTIAKCMMP